MLINGFILIWLPWASADAGKYIADVRNAYSIQSERITFFKENELYLSDMRAVKPPQSSPAKITNEPRKCDCAFKDCNPHLYWQAVEVVCPDVIESMAKWDYEWTDGWLDFKFDTQHYKTNSPNTYRFKGNKLKLQNGFGA